MKKSYSAPSITAYQLPDFDVVFEPVFHVEDQRLAAVEAFARQGDGGPFEDVADGLDSRLLPSLCQKIAYEAIRAAANLEILKQSVMMLIRMPCRLEAGKAATEFLVRTAVEAGLAPARFVLEFPGDSFVKARALAGLVSGYRALCPFPGLTSRSARVMKLDCSVVRAIDREPERQKLLRSFMDVCERNNVLAVAEDVEHRAECETLAELGVLLMQGSLFAEGIPGALNTTYYSCATAHSPQSESWQWRDRR